MVEGFRLKGKPARSSFDYYPQVQDSFSRTEIKIFAVPAFFPELVKRKAVPGLLAEITEDLLPSGFRIIRAGMDCFAVKLIAKGDIELLCQFGTRIMINGGLFFLR